MLRSTSECTHRQAPQLRQRKRKCPAQKEVSFDRYSSKATPIQLRILTSADPHACSCLECTLKMMITIAKERISRESNPGHIDSNGVFYH